MSRFVLRRARREALVDDLVPDSVLALNVLAEARAGRCLRVGGPPPPPDRQISAPQAAIMARLRRCARATFPAPPASCDGAVGALLDCEDLYRLADSSTRRPFNIDRLKICKADLRVKYLGDVLTGEARAFLDDPDGLIAKTDEELEFDPPESVVPYTDPVLKASPGEMEKLLRSLHTAGLLMFRTHASSFVGLFNVAKKGGEWLRLVIDARATNSLHRRPPFAPLATASAIGSVEIDPDMLPPDAVPCGCGIDLRDGFYQLSLTELAHYFAIDHRVRAGDFNLKTVYDPGLRAEVSVSPLDVLFPCFQGLAMGWSWALYFCHSLLTSAMLDAAVRFGGLADREEASRQLVRDRAVPPVFGPRRPLLAPYVDNGNAIAWNAQESVEFHGILVGILEDLGFELKDLISGDAVFDMVGVVWDGHSRRWRHRRERF